MSDHLSTTVQNGSLPYDLEDSVRPSAFADIASAPQPLVFEHVILDATVTTPAATAKRRSRQRELLHEQVQSVSSTANTNKITPNEQKQEVDDEKQKDIAQLLIGTGSGFSEDKKQ